MDFRTALLEAARHAYHNSDITRFQLFRIRLACTSKKWCEQTAEAMMNQLIAEALIPVNTTSYETINWENFINKLIEYLPIILQILTLFLD